MEEGLGRLTHLSNEVTRDWLYFLSVFKFAQAIQNSNAVMLKSEGVQILDKLFSGGPMAD